MTTATKPTTPDKTAEPKVHPPTLESVKVGHLMALTFYVRVERIDGDELTAKGLNAGSPPEFVIKGRSLVAAANSADQHHEEMFVTQTRAIELLTSANPTELFTVHFKTKDGEPRTLRGRFIAADPRGYSNVEDLEIETKNRKPEERWRKVDNRTIEWIIIRGVKYTVKK